MARLYLVRHGHAQTSWDAADPDPPLDELGRAQAEARAQQLEDRGPIAILSSPLRRARQTAAPLERCWMVTARVDERVGEIRGPSTAPPQRSAWLQGILERNWHEIDVPLVAWRKHVIDALVEIQRDTVIFSHFVAINAVVGHALGDDRVTCFRPENCSCTVLDVEGSDFRIVELGSEGGGKVL